MYQAQRPRCGSFALSELCGVDHSHYPSYDGSSQSESVQSHTPSGGGTHQGHFGACCGGGLAFKVSQVLSWRLPPLLPILVGLVRQVVPQVNVTVVPFCTRIRVYDSKVLASGCPGLESVPALRLSALSYLTSLSKRLHVSTVCSSWQLAAFQSSSLWWCVAGRLPRRHGFKVSEDVLSASERQPTMLNVKVIISVYSWPASRTVVKQCSQASRDCMQL